MKECKTSRGMGEPMEQNVSVSGRQGDGERISRQNFCTNRILTVVITLRRIEVAEIMRHCGVSGYGGFIWWRMMVSKAPALVPLELSVTEK